MKCHKEFRSSHIAWEADVLPLNYARETEQVFKFVQEFGTCLAVGQGLDSTERRHTELLGTESPAKVPHLCEDCPPADYPTDKTRYLPCPRREGHPSGATSWSRLADLAALKERP